MLPVCVCVCDGGCGRRVDTRVISRICCNSQRGLTRRCGCRQTVRLLECVAFGRLKCRSFEFRTFARYYGSLQLVVMSYSHGRPGHVCYLWHRYYPAIIFRRFKSQRSDCSMPICQSVRGMFLLLSTVFGASERSLMPCCWVY